MNSIRGVRRLLPLAVMALVLSACSLTNPDGVLDSLAPEGPIAEDLAGLYWLVFWIAAVIFVLVQGGLVYTIIKYRARKDDDAEPKQI
ncbi:MAG: cytochrome B, partial [Acidimicrobiia bacterium]